MFVFVIFHLLSYVSGNVTENLMGNLVYLPRATAKEKENAYFNSNQSYCYRLTWLGGNLNRNNFHEVENKNCTEYLGSKSKEILCVDPIAVTFSGREPDLLHARKEYFKEVTCPLSKDHVCAKYTTYYNGMPMRIVRYCARIDIEMEGPMTSGCLTEKRGSELHEVCACVSGRGADGICNGSFAAFDPSKTFIIFLLGYYMIRFVW